MARASRTRLAGSIADRTLKSGVSKQYAQQIAAYLMTEKRTRELDSLLRDVAVDWANKGYVEVLARSAYPLSKETEHEIVVQATKLFSDAESITVTGVHDPSVIGGVEISVANQRLDLSVEAKLNKFKQLTTAGKE